MHNPSNIPDAVLDEMKVLNADGKPVEVLTDEEKYVRNAIAMGFAETFNWYENLKKSNPEFAKTLIEDRPEEFTEVIKTIGGRFIADKFFIDSYISFDVYISGKAELDMRDAIEDVLLSRKNDSPK